MTTNTRTGSGILWSAIASVISLACGASSSAEPSPGAAAPEVQVSKEPAPAGEACLGVADKGIWGDLDDKVQLALPAKLHKDRVTAQVDAANKLLVLSIDGFPRKVYPLTGAAVLEAGAYKLALRPGDRSELAPLLAADRISDKKRASDRDKDGVPDPLDILIGAKKTVLNADAYTEGYMKMPYPGGDVPRDVGVCTDVVIRAVRNAGLDLQQALHEDIKRARASYPMIKKNPDWQIDQRRVKTLLPYFVRHWKNHTVKLDDTSDPLRPGDVIFMDTFPSKSGPDHIGIISDTIGESGMPLVINNWTNGTVTAEMDLLPSVPVLYRFRMPE